MTKAFLIPLLQVSFLSDAEGRFMFERPPERSPNSFQAEPRGIKRHERLFGFTDGSPVGGECEEDIDREVQKRLHYTTGPSRAAGAPKGTTVSLDRKDSRKSFGGRETQMLNEKI
jgi:hypothetical protein